MLKIILFLNLAFLLFAVKPPTDKKKTRKNPKKIETLESPWSKMTFPQRHSSARKNASIA